MSDMQAVVERSVLVVDDDSDVRKMLVALLELEGYKVLQARDGMEALRSFSKVRPDVVLLDIGMPRLSGLEVLERFRSMTGFDDEVPVIMLSAFSEDHYIESSYRLGATIFFQKPANVVELLTIVARLSGNPN